MTYDDRSTTKPLTGTIFYILLALADRDRYGLDIVREVARRTGGEVRLGPGTLYNGVAKMLDEGLVEEVKAPTKDVDPRRRYYRVTEVGRQLAAAEAARLDRLLRAARAKQILPAERSA